MSARCASTSCATYFWARGFAPRSPSVASFARAIRYAKFAMLEAEAANAVASKISPASNSSGRLIRLGSSNGDSGTTCCSAHIAFAIASVILESSLGPLIIRNKHCPLLRASHNCPKRSFSRVSVFSAR